MFLCIYVQVGYIGNFYCCRSEYKKVLKSSMLRINLVISYDVMSRLVLLVTMVVASQALNIPLQPAVVFPSIPLIYLIVETVVRRLIFASMFISETRVTLQRLEVKPSLDVADLSM